MKKLILVTISLILFFSGCDIIGKKPNSPSSEKEKGKVFDETQPDKKGSIVEFPIFAKLSFDEVDQKLGTPKRTEGDPEKGYSKTFSINQGEAELLLEYDGDKNLSLMQLELSTKRDSSEDVLRAAGFNLKDAKPDWENAILKSWENREFNGVKFEEIKAGMHPPTKKWDEVEVTIKK